MSLQINMTPEDIDTLVKQSIMQAGFGTAITESVRAAFNGWDSPLKKAISDYISKVSRQILEENYAEAIRAAVLERITKELTDEIMQKCVSDTVRKMTNPNDY
jgi:hypothetical protein